MVQVSELTLWKGFLGPRSPTVNSTSLNRLALTRYRQSCQYGGRISLRLWFVVKCIFRLLSSLTKPLVPFPLCSRMHHLPRALLASVVILTLLHPWERRFSAAQTRRVHCFFNRPDLQKLLGNICTVWILGSHTWTTESESLGIKLVGWFPTSFSRASSFLLCLGTFVLQCSIRYSDPSSTHAPKTNKQKNDTCLHF